MGKKGSGKKTDKGKKVLFGVLFIVACFAAAYVLIEFHSDMLIVGVTAVVLMLSAFLFMNAVFAEKAKDWLSEDLDGEETFPGPGESSEFQLKMTKQMKELVSVQKDMLSAVKQQSAMLQAQIENLEQEIYTLSEKQIVQTKTVIKYSKENARQLAISERETLEHVLYEVKQAIEDNIGQITIQSAVAEPMVVERAVPVAELESEPIPEMIGFVEESASTAEVSKEPSLSLDSLEEVAESELFAVEEFPDDDEYEEPDLMALLDSLEEAVPADIEATDIETSEMDIPDIGAMDIETSEMDIPDIGAMDIESPEMDIPDIGAMDIESPEMDIPDIGAVDIEIPEIGALDMDIPDIAASDIEIPEMSADIQIPELDGLIGEIPDIEESVAEMPVMEEPKAEKPAPAPVVSDPNAMMTPEDIAKLLESMGV